MMQNLLSGILAVVIALTSMCGGLMNSNADRPFAAEINVELKGDPAALAIGGQSADSSKAIMDLISSLAIRIAGTADVGQLQIKLKDEPVASLNVQRQEDSWAVVSDLFPTSLLRVKNDTLASMMSQMNTSAGSVPGNLDFAAIADAAKVPFEQLLEQFRAKLGEPETGSFSVGGVEYTQKAIYNLTTKEALQMVLTAVKAIVSNETVSGIISQFSPNFTPDSLDETLENVLAADDADQPVLSAAEYRNGADKSAQEIVLSKDGQSIEILAAVDGKITTVTLHALDQLEGTIVYSDVEKELKAILTLSSPTGMIQLDIDVDVDDDGIDVDLDVTIPSGETSITMEFDLDIDWEAPVFSIPEGLKEIVLENVMQDGEAAEAFNTEVSQAMMAVLLKVTAAYPDIMMMMVPSTPGAGAVVEEAPAQ